MSPMRRSQPQAHLRRYDVRQDMRAVLFAQSNCLLNEALRHIGLHFKSLKRREGRCGSGSWTSSSV
eukprot:4832472-Amphidinium_carterae.1